MAQKVLHLSTYDAHGGAGRAAYSLHQAMLKAGVASEMWVAKKSTSDPTVFQRHPRRFRITSQLDRQLWKVQKSPVNTWRSPARFGALTAGEVNASDATVVNLHWITNGFLSIEELGKITKPLVWSMYDMWPFCGTEHYGVDSPDARWREGYTKGNRPLGEFGWDLDRHAWARKRLNWRPFLMLPASDWLTEAARSSALMKDWPITRIPHVVDADTFASTDKSLARRILGLPPEAPLIMFLASAGLRDKRKGFDLLERALYAVGQRNPEAQLVVVGPREQTRSTVAGLPVNWIGALHGDEALRTLYSAADVIALPSREDNMPLTAMEAQTCGRAVVAFDIGGLRDIVIHRNTGYLAPPGNIDALSDGLIEALVDARGANYWGNQARDHAIASWSAPIISSDYISAYARVSSKFTI